jgi:hypothetical protein
MGPSPCWECGRPKGWGVACRAQKDEGFPVSKVVGQLFGIGMGHMSLLLVLGEFKGVRRQGKIRYPPNPPGRLACMSMPAVLGLDMPLKRFHGMLAPKCVGWGVGPHPRMPCALLRAAGAPLGHPRLDRRLLDRCVVITRAGINIGCTPGRPH